MKYPKIETLFIRNENGKVDETKIRVPVFDYIKYWLVTEKIDGMNIRVFLSKDGNVTFSGRTDNAILPQGLLEYLTNTFTPEKMKTIWIDEPCDVILFGEGYGGKIQKDGKKYNLHYSFRLFDVFIGVWLDWEDVEYIAKKLEIKTVPVSHNSMDLERIVNIVKNEFVSMVSLEEGTLRQAEGIVARTPVPLFLKNGDRVMFKLKTKDFEEWKKNAQKDEKFKQGAKECTKGDKKR